jgi:hypothetical protein
MDSEFYVGHGTRAVDKTHIKVIFEDGIMSEELLVRLGMKETYRIFWDHYHLNKAWHSGEFAGPLSVARESLCPLYKNFAHYLTGAYQRHT